MTRIWALIPVKKFDTAKSRLASAMSDKDRCALAMAMARDVATALKHARTIARVAMVSDITALEQVTGLDGIDHFHTRQAQGLNEDLALAARWAETQGATHVLIVHADLPQLTSQAIDSFVAGVGDMPASQIRVAACKQGTGTNLLLAPVPLPLSLVFGRNSLARFCECAGAANISVDVVRDPVLANDIDTPEDLHALMSNHADGNRVGQATADFLFKAMTARPTPAALSPIGQKTLLQSIS
ncbi:Phosphoenolpyruvate guanylyltransferase [Afipia felis]